MKIFISYSGEQSETVGKGVRKLLRNIFGEAVKPWMARADLKPGARWNAKLVRKLETSRAGIICLTDDNMNKPWILFEAGALSKRIRKKKSGEWKETLVVPYLIGSAPEPDHPLAQFQTVDADKKGTRRLIQEINKRLGDDGFKHKSTLKERFGQHWPEFEGMLEQARNDP